MAIPHTETQRLGEITATSLNLGDGATVTQIATDVGLGGESPSDEKLATQKAIKSYADALPAIAPITKTANAFGIMPASATDAGYVTTDAQSFAGQKTCADGLVAPTRDTGDNTTHVATTAFVSSAAATAIKYGAFDVSNGWISGGAISATPFGTTFSIAQCVCRFTDYSNPANPVVGIPTTYGPWLNVTSAYPDALLIGVYLDKNHPETLYQNPNVSLNASLLYSDYVQLGIIVQDRGVIARVTNNKFPWASRGNVAAIEFCDRIAPLNLGPLAVAAHASIPLAIRIGIGQLWSIGINLPDNYLNPNIVTIPPIGQGDPALDPPPVMYRVWGDNLGEFHYDGPLNPLDPAQLDEYRVVTTTHYNPGGNSETLIAIPAGEWVAIPIIFNKSVDLYLWQYATSSHPTKEMAMANAGKFVRFPQLGVVNVIGYIIYQEGVADWSTATFTGGEFFNYGVGGSSGGSGGGSVANTIYRRTNTAWVDQTYGSDTTGTITYASLPFRTWEGVASSIAGQTIDNAYFVNFSAGTHNLTTFALEPFISFGGSSGLSTVIHIDNGAPSNVTINAAAFAGVANAEIIGGDMRFGGGTGWDLDFAAMGPSFGNLSTINVSRINITGVVNYKGRAIGAGGDPFASGDALRFQSSFLDAAVNLDGGAIYADSTVFAATAPITISATTANSTLVLTGSQVAAITASGTRAIMIVLSGSSVLGNIVVDGANVVLRVSRDSIPPAPFTVQVLNGATYIVYDDQLTPDQAAGIAASAQPINAGNPIVDTQTFNTAQGTKVDKTTTVNGHALSSNVVVSASDLTTGTLPHAQLPALVSGDIPNNAANTSGTASALSGASLLPNGTTAILQAQGDNSTKIATTSYVDRLIGAASGIASLDVTGKVPVSQLPDTVVGAMEYKGVLNASAGVYPAQAEKGDYYVINVAGTISGTYYNINDWAVYNGVSWDQIENTDVASALSTWTGNGVLASVGTITSGSWNATVIPAAKGGAGAISGIMKANGAGVVSAAIADSDYVAPSTVSVIGGEKTITLLKTTTRAVGDDSTWAATTAFVQAFANKTQSSIIYMSAAGSDALNGATINNAVATFPRAITLSAGASAAAPIVIYCEDARVYDGAALVLIPYVCAQALSLTMKSACTIGDNSSLEFGSFAAPAAITFTGGTGAGPACVRAKRSYGVAITVDASQGTRYIAIDSLEMVNNTTTVITCGSKLCVAAQRVVGRITTTSVSAIVDLTNVAFIDITTTGTGTVLYPPVGAGSALGILKCNGAGVVTAASAGSDYLIGNQTITLSGDVAGSGATAIATTIGGKAITFAKMADLAANSIIANVTGAPATPAALVIGSANVASTAVMRNASGCASATHFSDALEVHNMEANITLTAASASTQRITGAITSTIALPNASTLTIGHKYNIINDASNIINVTNSAGTLLGTIAAQSRAQYYYAVVNGTIGTWTINTMMQPPSSQTIDVGAGGAGGVSLTAISASIIYIIGTGPYNLLLPDARTMMIGQSFTIYQTSAGIITLKRSDGTVVFAMASGIVATVTCNNNSSAGGVWLARTCCMNNPQRLISYKDISGVSPVVLQLTASDVYGGPLRINTSASGSFLLPTASDLITTLTTLLGFIPPVGWYFDAWIIGSSGVTSLTKLIAGTGGTLYRPSYGGTSYSGYGWKLTIWITSNVPTYTYNALVLEFY